MMIVLRNESKCQVVFIWFCVQESHRKIKKFKTHKIIYLYFKINSSFMESVSNFATKDK